MTFPKIENHILGHILGIIRKKKARFPEIVSRLGRAVFFPKEKKPYLGGNKKKSSVNEKRHAKKRHLCAVDRSIFARRRRRRYFWPNLAKK